MKAFEKRWNHGMLSGSPGTFGEPTRKEIARFAWRAALEWTLKTEKELTEQDAPIFMSDVIKQELELTDESTNSNTKNKNQDAEGDNRRA